MKRFSSVTVLSVAFVGIAFCLSALPDAAARAGTHELGQAASAPARSALRLAQSTEVIRKKTRISAQRSRREKE